MSYRIVHRPAVEDDVACAIGYYKRKSPQLADRFLQALRETSSYLNHYPKAFMVRYRQVRTLPLLDFPFIVHYIVDDEMEEVVILAVCHASRNFADFFDR